MFDSAKHQCPPNSIMSNSGGKSGSTEGLNIMKKLLKTGNLKRGGNKGSSLNAGAIEHPGDIAAGGATGRTLDRIISAKEDVSKRENYKLRTDLIWLRIFSG